MKCRGSVVKRRALALNTGNFSIISNCLAKKTAIHGVKYHPTTNEYVRSDILMKSGIVEVDGTPFKLAIEKNPKLKIDPAITKQLESGATRLLARITSRPGQTGRADGVILEGQEFDFYNKKIVKTR